MLIGRMGCEGERPTSAMWFRAGRSTWTPLGTIEEGVTLCCSGIEHDLTVGQFFAHLQAVRKA